MSLDERDQKAAEEYAEAIIKRGYWNYGDHPPTIAKEATVHFLAGITHEREHSKRLVEALKRVAKQRLREEYEAEEGEDPGDCLIAEAYALVIENAREALKEYGGGE